MKSNLDSISCIQELEFCQKYLERFNLKFLIEELISKNRDSYLVFMRALIVLILTKRGFKCQTIGAIINRDHSTVLHLKKYERSQGKYHKYDDLKRFILNDKNIKGIGEPTKQNGYNGYKYFDFQDWLKSEHGKKCIDFKSLSSEEYLKNRLWWAFMEARKEMK